VNSKVFINGKFLDPDQATVSVFDRGFLFSDSVYEVIHVDGNKLFLFEEHIERLKRSLSELDMDFPNYDFLTICQELLKISPVDYGGIYIQVTRGTQQPRSHFWHQKKLLPNVVAFAQSIKRPEKKALKAITYPDLRWGRCDVKSTSLLANVLAREEAAKNSCDEALLVSSSGWVSEGSSTNLFVCRNGVVKTPPLSENILPGVTRKFCLEVLNELAIPYKEEKLSKEELFNSDEVWITSSTKDVLPLESIDGIELKFEMENSLWEQVFNRFKEKKLKSLK